MHGGLASNWTIGVLRPRLSQMTVFSFKICLSGRAAHGHYLAPQSSRTSPHQAARSWRGCVESELAAASPYPRLGVGQHIVDSRSFNVHAQERVSGRCLVWFVSLIKQATLWRGCVGGRPRAIRLWQVEVVRSVPNCSIDALSPLDISSDCTEWRRTDERIGYGARGHGARTQVPCDASATRTSSPPSSLRTHACANSSCVVGFQ